MNILNEIVNYKRKEIEASKLLIPEKTLISACYNCLRSGKSFSKALEKSETGIIAEFKTCSPSKGAIHLNASVATVVKEYEANGATCCSILTDTRYFGGSLTNLMVARNSTSLPLLRKDFIVDSYQLYQARLSGADAILLIASILTKNEIATLSTLAHALEMEVLLEIHDESEIEKMSDNVDLIGVNNRNLKDFTVDINHSISLIKHLPKHLVKVSESGIRDMKDVKLLREAGYKGFLIGETFMKEEHPGKALNKFISGYAK